MTGQLMVFRFDREMPLEGRLAGALERIENGGTLRVAEAFFVRVDADTEEVDAVHMQGRGIGGFITELLRFRLEPEARRSITKRAFESRAGDMLRDLAGSLEPGAAVAAVLVEHVWVRAIDDAVARTGGVEVMNEFVDTTTLDPDVLARAAAPR